MAESAAVTSKLYALYDVEGKQKSIWWSIVIGSVCIGGARRGLTLLGALHCVLSSTVYYYSSTVAALSRKIERSASWKRAEAFHDLRVSLLRLGRGGAIDRGNCIVPSTWHMIATSEVYAFVDYCSVWNTEDIQEVTLAAWRDGVIQVSEVEDMVGYQSWWR